MSLVINATYGGNDPERRKNQVTKKMLIESGTVLFKIDLEFGELSYFDIRDGRLMLELKNGRYTTIHMAPEKVHLILNVPNEFFKVIDDMLTRIDNNREAYQENKKAKDRWVYGEPVNPVNLMGVSFEESLAQAISARQWVGLGLRRLSDKQRRAWVGYRIHGLKLAEIAEMEGISAQSVSERVKAADKIMRAAYIETNGKR